MIFLRRLMKIELRNEWKPGVCQRTFDAYFYIIIEGQGVTNARLTHVFTS